VITLAWIVTAAESIQYTSSVLDGEVTWYAEYSDLAWQKSFLSFQGDIVASVAVEKKYYTTNFTYYTVHMLRL